MAFHGGPRSACAGRALGLLLSTLSGVSLIGLMVWAVVARVDPGSPPPVAPVQLVDGSRDALALSVDVINALGVVTAPVKPAKFRDHLELVGSLSVDANQMVRVRSRFSGEVVTIGTTNPAVDDQVVGEPRPLRVGNRVVKDQLLAIVWSKEIGEKKSDLVDAVSQFIRDDRQDKQLQGLVPGLVALKEVREVQQRRESDLITIERVERTLRSWKLTQPEIDAVKAEAETIHKDKERRTDVALARHWAEAEVRAPFDGIILERNVTLGDIVDTGLDLFKVADLSKLGGMVHVYEENLPDLESLPPEAHNWTIRVKAQQGSAGFPGSFDAIGNIIDPTQHTATVMGWGDNRLASTRR